MKTFVYRPKGVCSQQMTFTMDGDIIRDVKIVGGCAGNLLGISRILKDKKISEVMEAFHGVDLMSRSDCDGFAGICKAAQYGYLTRNL